MQFLADASTNSQPSLLASANPSCEETARSTALSLLLPTSMIGTGPSEVVTGAFKDEERYVAPVGEPELTDSLTLLISLLNSSIREKDDREVML